MKTPTTKETLKSNPEMTYVQAIGYSIGAAAAALGQKYASLSAEEWRTAGDEYAHGYRKGYLDYERRAQQI